VNKHIYIVFTGFVRIGKHLGLGAEPVACKRRWHLRAGVVSLVNLEGVSWFDESIPPNSHLFSVASSRARREYGDSGRIASLRAVSKGACYLRICSCRDCEEPSGDTPLACRLSEQARRGTRLRTLMLQNVEALQQAGAMSLLRPLLLDNVPGYAP